MFVRQCPERGLLSQAFSPSILVFVLAGVSSAFGAMTTAACQWCIQARVTTTRQDLPRRVIRTVSMSRRLSMIPTSFLRVLSRNLERHGMTPARCSSTRLVPEDTFAAVWIPLIDPPRHSLMCHASCIVIARMRRTCRLHCVHSAAMTITTMVAVMTLVSRMKRAYCWKEVRANSIS